MIRTWLRAIRLHQWSKNALILVPAAAAHAAVTGPVVERLGVAVLAFCFLASAVYLLNDVADLEHDRAHPTKRDRPLAAGDISVPAAVVAAVVLAAVSLALALRLSGAFVGVWASYLGLTTAYSFSLKRVVMLDVVVLAALYATRVVAGAVAVTVALSPWFVAFAVFVFASLALLKRMVETQRNERADGDLPGRGWEVGDRPVVLAFGAGSAVAAALVYVLYITGDSAVERLYARPEVLILGLPVLLYWLGRVWLLAYRGAVQEDPLLFALRDRVSWATLALMLAIVWLAT